jgi:hypothetical protein
MEVTTPYGKAGTTIEDLAEVLDGMQDVDDPEMFVTVQGENAFLQMRQLPIEMGRDGRLFRARIPEAIRKTFLDFAAGHPGWDRGIEWIDVEDIRRAPETRLARVLTLVFVGIACITVGWALARILPRVL